MGDEGVNGNHGINGINAMAEMAGDYGDYGYDEEYEEEIEDERYELREAMEDEFEEELEEQYDDEYESFDDNEHGQSYGVLSYDDDDAGYEALMEYDAEHEQEAYYDGALDAKEEAMVEDYDALYDVNGEGGDVEEDIIVGELEGDSETLMQKKEADAMIADAFWGLEVYSVAFGVLCCLCIVCACHRRSVQAAEAEKAFGYAPYGGNHANGNGGF